MSMGSSSERLSLSMSWCMGFLEYETPKVVTLRNAPLGILRLVLQLAVVAFVVVYQLWWAKGYQEFTEVESSVTTKVKGFSRSHLPPPALRRLPEELHTLYQKVWDEADYVVPPAENGAFFVMTNAIITPNQRQGVCPEDPDEVPHLVCSNDSHCVKDRVMDITNGHGVETGICVPSDRKALNVCQIHAWCPIERDKLPLRENEGALINDWVNYTVFIKNSIAFSRFGNHYERKNMRDPKAKGSICIFDPAEESTHLCPIFRLGDIVALAKGNASRLAVSGGVVGIDILWDCNLDLNFMQNCLPNYRFRMLDDYGWNFRFAHFHSVNRRTLVKAYGLKFLLIIEGRAGKFDLKNTVIVLVTGLGLLGLSTVFCDFILLHYSPERNKVKEKKYESLSTTTKMLQSTMSILGHTSSMRVRKDTNHLTPSSPSKAIRIGVEEAEEEQGRANQLHDGILPA